MGDPQVTMGFNMFQNYIDWFQDLDDLGVPRVPPILGHLQRMIACLSILLGLLWGLYLKYILLIL